MPKAKKIITIDDDPFYESLYKDILGAKGFVVEHALSAIQGFRSIQELSPDLVTLDIMMPEQEQMMDGYGLLEEIRCLTACKKLPIVMISSLDQEGDIKRALDLGADEFIPKSRLSPATLIKVINRLIK